VRRIVIIGNSAAGLAAIEAIRSHDTRSRLTLIAAERHPPYSRIMLTYLLSGKAEFDLLSLHGPDWYERMAVKALTGRRAVAINTERREVVTKDSSSPAARVRRIPYDLLLIATGASAQRPDLPGIDLPGVFCLRDLDDATAIIRHLDTDVPRDRQPRAIFLGGGPVCLQALTAFAHRGLKTTLLVRSKAILSQLADARTAGLAERVLRANGVSAVKGVEVIGIEVGSGSRRSAPPLIVVTRQGRRFPTNLVIIGKGTQPNVELTANTDVATDRGILVDDTMATTCPGVFAAGDVAQATHCVTGRKVCYGTWTNACEQGRIAGLNMAGCLTKWTGGLNRNVTTLFGHTLGSVGAIHADDGAGDKLQRYADRRRGVARRLLFSDGRCNGAVLWNACDDLGVLGWLIATRRDCTGWEARLARGPAAYADAVQPKLVRSRVMA